MSEYKSGEKLGDGLADSLIREVNQEVESVAKILIANFFKFLKEKVQNVDIDKLLSKNKQDELIALWSTQLVESGLIPKGYSGLSDEHLVHNLLQDGYLAGLYAGYLIAMMSLVDNGASKELIVSVRDSIRPYFLGHCYSKYCNRNEIKQHYDDGKYCWIEKAKNDN